MFEREFFHESNAGLRPVLADFAAVPACRAGGDARPGAQLQRIAGSGAAGARWRRAACLRRFERNRRSACHPRLAGNHGRRQSDAAPSARQRFFHCLFKSLPARFFHGGRRIQHRAAHGSRRRRVGAIRPVFRGWRHIAHRRRQQRCRRHGRNRRLHQPARRRSLRQHGGQCARRRGRRQRHGSLAHDRIRYHDACRQHLRRRRHNHGRHGAQPV